MSATIEVVEIQGGADKTWFRGQILIRRHTFQHLTNKSHRSSSVCPERDMRRLMAPYAARKTISHHRINKNGSRR